MHLYLYFVVLIQTGSKGDRYYYIRRNFARNTITYGLTSTTVCRYIYHRLWQVIANKRKSGRIDWKVWRCGWELIRSV
jgi:hypothetical protein